MNMKKHSFRKICLCVFLFAFLCSISLNIYHYRRRLVSFFAVFSMPLNASGSIFDEENAWYCAPFLLIAYAGGGINGLSYLNSEEAIRSSIEAGAKVIEIDVSLTADGVPVLSHDFMPDHEIMFEQRPTLAEFLSNPLPGNQTPLTFDAFIEKFGGWEGNFLIDTKMHDELAVAYWLEEHCPAEVRNRFIFQIGSKRLLEELSRKKIFSFLHYNGKTIERLEQMLPLLRKYNVHTVSISDDAITGKDSLENLCGAGLHVYVFTVNHRRRMDYVLKAGASGVFTDRLLVE